MKEIKIKRISTVEMYELQKIGRQTFIETFAALNTEENMNHYLEKSFSSENILSELQNPDSEFYFAELNSQIIGYLKLNLGNSQTENMGSGTLEIERIYVLENHHGKNVGLSLMKRAFEVARKKNAKYIWLSVWEKNTREIKFYEKMGFSAFDKHVFQLGDDKQIDIMMKMILT